MSGTNRQRLRGGRDELWGNNVDDRRRHALTILAWEFASNDGLKEGEDLISDLRTRRVGLQVVVVVGVTLTDTWIAGASRTISIAKSS